MKSRFVFTFFFFIPPSSCRGHSPLSLALFRVSASFLLFPLIPPSSFPALRGRNGSSRFRSRSSTCAYRSALSSRGPPPPFQSPVFLSAPPYIRGAICVFANDVLYRKARRLLAFPLLFCRAAEAGHADGQNVFRHPQKLLMYFIILRYISYIA